MKNVFKYSLITALAILCFFATRSARADFFQGEVVSVDEHQGTFKVRSQTQNGMEERTFQLPARQMIQIVPAVSTLQDLEAGDQIQVSATHQNGIWKIQSLKTNPQNPSRPSVFVAKGNSSEQPAEAVFVSKQAASPQPVNLVLQVPNAIPSPQQRGPVTIIPPTAGGTSNTVVALPVQLQSVPPSNAESNLATVNPASGVNTFNSSFTGTTLTPSGVTTSGIVSSIPSSNPQAPPTVGPITTGTPARSGAESAPARNGAQNS